MEACKLEVIPPTDWQKKLELILPYVWIDNWLVYYCLGWHGIICVYAAYTGSCTVLCGDRFSQCIAPIILDGNLENFDLKSSSMNFYDYYNQPCRILVPLVRKMWPLIHIGKLKKCLHLLSFSITYSLDHALIQYPLGHLKPQC